jgi:hypothetical protein
MQTDGGFLLIAAIDHENPPSLRKTIQIKNRSEKSFQKRIIAFYQFAPMITKTFQCINTITNYSIKIMANLLFESGLVALLTAVQFERFETKLRRFLPYKPKRLGYMLY